MKFAEFYNGQVLESGMYKVSEAEILEFAKAYDPQWFHVDPEASKHGRFKTLIASGWQTCGIAMKLLVPLALDGSESFASPGLKYVKWPNPVRPDDELSLRATVVDVRRSASRPNLGLLHWRWQLFNQDGAEVLDLEATSLFDLS